MSQFQNGLTFAPIYFVEWEEQNNVEEDEVIGWEMSLERSSQINGSIVMETSRHYAISIEPLNPISEIHPPGCGCMLAKCALMQALLNDDNESSLDGEEIVDIT